MYSGDEKRRAEGARMRRMVDSDIEDLKDEPIESLRAILDSRPIPRSAEIAIERIVWMRAAGTHSGPPECVLQDADPAEDARAMVELLDTVERDPQDAYDVSRVVDSELCQCEECAADRDRDRLESYKANMDKCIVSIDDILAMPRYAQHGGATSCVDDIGDVDDLPATLLQIESYALAESRMYYGQGASTASIIYTAGRFADHLRRRLNLPVPADPVTAPKNGV